MCGRFANQQESQEAWDVYFDGEHSINSIIDEVTIGYNVAPTQTIPVVTPSGWLATRWGMIPPWSNEISTKFATFNARSETLAEKATFRDAWKNGQRCIVPAICYFEWKKEGKTKQQYSVHLEDSTPFALGGLYQPSRGNIPASCTIITLPANVSLASLHPRMPLILKLDCIEGWLRGDETDFATTLVPGTRVSLGTP